MRLHGFPVQGGQGRRVVGGEGDFLLLVGDFDHHGLEDALVAAVHGGDLAAGGRGVFHTVGLFIREEQLALLDRVAFADLHGRFHPHVVAAEHGDRTDLMTLLDRLARRTGDGKVKPLLDFDHSVSPTLRVAEVERRFPGDR